MSQIDALLEQAKERLKGSPNGAIAIKRKNLALLIDEIESLRASRGQYDESVRFDGDDYVPLRDNPRLTKQLNRIFTLMSDGKWRTLGEIESLTGDPAASVSAQLRHLRKERYGSHTVNKRHRGDPTYGLYEYQLILNRK